ncbi:MAG: efflux RND transporter permease subunit, partial [Opitutales bacterium]
MFSKIFIDRPVFASVLSIVIVLFGLISMMSLPVAQYPEILPPEVMVSASYPGATAEVIATTVASPLEQAINGVDGMLYMTSSASDAGSLMLSIAFAVGTDPDQNTINVSNRVQTALSQLPQSVRTLGVTVTKRSSTIMGIGTLYSPGGQYDSAFLNNYALLNIIDELKRTDGVGEAQLFGRFNYSMRVWINPDKLAMYGLTSVDVASAINEQNSQFAAGSIGAEPSDGESNAFTYSITTQGRLITPKEFGEIILKSDSTGSVLKLSDVARIELGTQNYGVSGTLNGMPAANIGIFLQPGANAMATS